MERAILRNEVIRVRRQKRGNEKEREKMDRETVLLRLTTSFSKGETAKTAISRRNRREFPRRCRKGGNDAIHENGVQRRDDETAARPSSCMTDYNG